MKKMILFLIFSALIISACARQNEDFVGKGSDVPSENEISKGMPVPGSDAEEMAVSDEIKEFQIEAKQFAFVPGTITVNKGDKVRLIVTSTDIPHGIAIKEYGINERLEPGKPVIIEFTADKEGSFTAYCSVFCGSGHSDMKGKLIVK